MAKENLEATIENMEKDDAEPGNSISGGKGRTQKSK